MNLLKRNWLALATATTLLAACGGGGGGSAPAGNTAGAAPVSSTSPQQPSDDRTALASNSCTSAKLSNRSSNGLNTVSVSGIVSYDFIPASEFNGLDYNNIEARPARGITVQAVTNFGIIGSVTADANGFYELDVPKNQAVTIRARAELLSDSHAKWNVRVEDNTSNGALYVLDANISDTRSDNLSCDLHAPAGWSNSEQRYSETRAAAPFAIADTIYTAIEANVAVDSDVNMPPLVVNWSIRNTPAGNCSGGISSGCIGTSYYSNGEMFVLGAANIDTDEHDSHVISHEWSHYFEHNLSRSDSIGGSHSGASTLDARVAMGEGFANAASAIFLHDALYKDSSGNRQSQGFDINVEENEDRGWFNEDSVQSLIYDIVDTHQDGSDTLNTGWATIYNALTSESYKNTPAVTSIFALLHELQSTDASFNRELNAMAASRGINSHSPYGTGETNNNGDELDVLPFVTGLTQNRSQTICSIDRFGSSNRLSNYRFMRLNVPTSGRFNFSARPAGASPSQDPDLRITQAGEEIIRFDATGAENGSIELAAGDYLVEASEYCFTNPGASSCRDSQINGRSCMDVTVSRL